MRYFAYGSNMCTARLRARLPAARLSRRAMLTGWQLRFDKRSVDGSGKCTIRALESGSVHGVMFDVDAAQVAVLDREEGPGYARSNVVVEANGRSLEAITYVARRSWIDASLAPYDWYLGYVLAGALEHGLPAAYVESTLEVAVRPDPDAERSRLHRRVLEGALMPSR